MGILDKVKRGVQSALASDEEKKRLHELAYWEQRKEKEGTLSNAHYDWFYTTHFGFTLQDYEGKRILDIGCGPRGSLDWADGAEERIGLDPLADDYKELGEIKTKLVAAGGEDIPFEDGHFDVVCSFNSLDHVDDLDQTIAEIKRVTKPGGYFLLLTDVNHEPTVCEPITLEWETVELFTDAFELLEVRHYEKGDQGMYNSIREGVEYDHEDPAQRYGILSAKFQRKSS